MKLGVLENVGFACYDRETSFYFRTQLHDRHEVISRLARGMICKIQRKNGNFIEIQHQLLAVKEFYAQFDGEIIP
jgi:hypothetical protein